jgi:hypothetical protein
MKYFELDPDSGIALTSTARYLACFVALAWVLSLTACDSATSPENALVYSTLPVLNSAPIPDVGSKVDTSTNLVSISIIGADSARYFEVDRSYDSSLTKWTLFATPDTTKSNLGFVVVNVGFRDSTRRFYIRVRSVYSYVVSQWSGIFPF